jgi:hypothetical protein
MDYFKLWLEDRQCILATMIRNLAADLAAGYDYFGRSAVSQREEIEAYKRNTDVKLDDFVNMTDTQVNRWCRFDLIKRGVIEP